jgi:hypothetical protein
MKALAPTNMSAFSSAGAVTIENITSPARLSFTRDDI